MARTSHQQIYQLKITLEHSKPPIWRRILVDAKTPLSDLHDILQIVMGWENCHLHQFSLDGEIYGPPDTDDWRNENRYKLNQLLTAEKDKMLYEYDFGDSWLHKIVLEKILPSSVQLKVPSCIKGKGACPPEDVGGMWGYYHFLEAIQDPNHPDHDDMKDWVDGDFDPDYLDLDEINDFLSGDGE